MNNAFLFVIDRGPRAATAKIAAVDRDLSAFNYCDTGPTAVPHTVKSDPSPGDRLETHRFRNSVRTVLK
jgi:hypothetical protein